MDAVTLAEFYLVLWMGALSTLGLVGVAKWIWHVIATGSGDAGSNPAGATDINI